MENNAVGVGSLTVLNTRENDIFGGDYVATKTDRKPLIILVVVRSPRIMKALQAEIKR